MGARIGKGAVIAALGVVLAACGDAEQCESGCPDVSGEYSLTASLPVGECGFQPYLLPPTIFLEQPAGSGEVLTFVIDPIQQLELPLSGVLFTPEEEDEEDEEDELIGSFRFLARPSRVPTRLEPGLASFEIILSGSVYEDEDDDGNEVRFVSGQLVQVQIGGVDGIGDDTGCTVIQSFTGVDRTPGLSPPLN